MTGHMAYTELRQLFDVQFAIVIDVEAIEFGAHEGHELGPGDFAALVGIHQKQQLLGLDLPGLNLFFARLFSLAGESGAATKGDGGSTDRST